MLWVVLAAGAGAGELESKVFVIGDADLHEVEAAVKSMLSSKGKTVLLVKERKLLVVDGPEHVAAVESIIHQFNAPRPNVRVEIMFQETTGVDERGVDVRGRIGGRDVSVGNRPGPNGVEIGVVNRRTSTSSMANQFLVVQSGRTASIAVVREVPFVDYFYQYALGLGYITAAETRWRAVGTQMAVTPRVRGQLIDVEVYPQISRLVDAQREVIDLRELATVITVAPGVTVNIGGFQGADEEFNRNFFGGGGRTRGNQSVGFSLRASLL